MSGVLIAGGFALAFIGLAFAIAHQLQPERVVPGYVEVWDLV